MVVEEIVLESRNSQRYAPPTAEVLEQAQLVDDQFEKQLREIPNKMAFKIGEVASLAGVKPYVLRYWESEFNQLKPQKSKNNQRVYAKRDVETVLMIKKLLYTDRFSIEGARTAIKRLKKETKKVKQVNSALEHLESGRHQLEDLLLQIGSLRKLLEG